MKKTLLIALGLAMSTAAVYAQPATTAKSFRMYNDPLSSVTITASAAPGTGIFTWPQPAAGVFKSTAGGIMSIGSVALGTDVSGLLPVGNGGTGIGSVPLNHLLVGTGGSALTTLAPVANMMLATDGTGTPSWQSFPPPGFTVPFNMITSGDNTQPALMRVGTGSVLRAVPASTGIVEANQFVNAASTSIAVDLATSEVAGTLPIANGGTNQTGAAVNGAVIWSDANSYEYTAVGVANQILKSNGAAAPTWVNANSVVTGSALTKTDDANVTLTLGGTPGTALLQATSLTLGWSGQLAIARGGTNGTAAPTAGAVAYGTGAAYGFTAAGTAGQFLQSTGAAAPTWATGSIALAKGFQAGNGAAFSYTVTPGVDLTAASQIMITFKNAGPGGLQTTYSIVEIDAVGDDFTVEFANILSASEGFSWIVF